MTLHHAFIGLGANLGHPADQIHKALSALDAHAEIQLLRASSLYASDPIDAPGQPEYVNAVATIDTTLTAAQLLLATQAIEAQMGRQRPYPNAPRTLDLDLLLFDDGMIDTPDLKIPHPRMHLRRFVLEPLLEIAPAVEIPGWGAAARLLPALLDQAVYRLATN
ncbi:MAG: 2-amino-4-hydroxy-6-hydroxymethyldihydropteridine diphosphokinase [Burkholderiales bacterium]